jgi:glycosyltransferase involved in cell wall biosynthesis
MKVLVFPRDTNPYQDLLYGEMQPLGVAAIYVGELTPIRSLNLLLLPLEVAVRGMGGARVIHLHWVFTFAFPGARRFPVMRWVAQIWFHVLLWTCRMIGVHLVWTAHNVLPHEQVLGNDISARRALVEASDLVLAHSQSTLDELAALGAVPRRSAIIRHGPFGSRSAAELLRTPGCGGGPRGFLFFGFVREYKGVDDLLAAFATLPEDVAAHLTVAGRCDDPSLRSRLRELARRGGSNIVLRLEHVPDEDVSQLLAAADVVVLPFRRATTSGSAMLALSHGRPLIVPNLAALADLPDQAVLRYDGGVTALASSVIRLARADADTLAAMSAAARDYAFQTTWQEIADRTTSEMVSILCDVPDTDVHSRARQGYVK